MYRRLLPAVLLLGMVIRSVAAARAAASSLVMEDEFVHPTELAVLTTKLPIAGPTGAAAAGPFRKAIDVPASLYARLLKVLAADAPAAEMTVVPAKAEHGHVPPHQDHLADGAVAQGTVGLVYLAGDGQLTFTHTATGEETVVDVKPGRLLTWDNAAYTHTLVAGESPRAMLGPMTFKDGAFTAVGDFFCCVFGQLHFKALLAKPGSIVTAMADIVVTGPRSVGAPRDLVASLTHDAAAGRLTLLQASVSPKKFGPKLQPSQVGNTINFTIPAAQVQAKKEMTIVYKFRLARDAPSDTELDFRFIAGTLTDTVTVVVK